jgi:hypothetical protein
MSKEFYIFVISLKEVSYLLIGILILEHPNMTNKSDWFVEFVERKSRSKDNCFG